jgi:Cu(I)/Ag(I) efflux system periplasmic protein CusF
MKIIGSAFFFSIHALTLAGAVAFTAPQRAEATNHTTGSSTQIMSDMADGEVRKVDKDAKKITLRHGELKQLDMPPMTMVFLVKDPALLDKVKAGDKVKFRAQNSGGTMVVTDIEVIK